MLIYSSKANIVLYDSIQLITSMLFLIRLLQKAAVPDSHFLLPIQQHASTHFP
jgi:hypothetical protein